ncbi:MAG TPA: peroxiredoxin [Polyangiaceae bacterium]|nr:peroxiredoxin [Polyangiaceae bacterium]
MLRVGTPAPPFEGRDSRGQPLNLADFRGKKNVVLFFFPRSFTPGCTAEVCSFRDAYQELSGRDTVLVGVSLDRADVQQRFIDQFELPFHLLSDEDQRVSRAYEALGVIGSVLKMPRRVTYLIDKEGVVRAAFRHELAIKRHLDDVRSALAALP